MTLAGGQGEHRGTSDRGIGRGCRRSLAEVRAAGRAAAEKLAEAERLRAEAVAELVEFDAINAHVADGYLTPQRHLIHRGRVADREANRVQRLVRFCADHPAVADALAAGRIGLDHADSLRAAAKVVGFDPFVAALSDLLAAADGVEWSVFDSRVRAWQWSAAPERTEDEVDRAFDHRHVTLQPGLFGGLKGNFELEPVGAQFVAAAMEVLPDPNDRWDGPRTLGQRRADRLVELCAGEHEHHDDSVGDEQMSEGTSTDRGARATVRASVEVVIDLATLVRGRVDLENHRTVEGDVDWDSILSAFDLTGRTPTCVLQQFLCDASWRNVVTAGRSQVLDVTDSVSELTTAQRRAVRRRDVHCRFEGCDRSWRWCDVHHLQPRHEGGQSTLDNLALVCRRHHSMIHQQGWQLARAPDGAIITSSP